MNNNPEEGCDTSTDYGDWLLANNGITKTEYNLNILLSKKITNGLEI